MDEAGRGLRLFDQLVCGDGPRRLVAHGGPRRHHRRPRQEENDSNDLSFVWIETSLRRQRKEGLRFGPFEVDDGCEDQPAREFHGGIVKLAHWGTWVMVNEELARRTFSTSADSPGNYKNLPTITRFTDSYVRNSLNERTPSVSQSRWQRWATSDGTMARDPGHDNLIWMEGRISSGCCPKCGRPILDDVSRKFPPGPKSREKQKKKNKKKKKKKKKKSKQANPATDCIST